jgi:hypothetical protein
LVVPSLDVAPVAGAELGRAVVGEAGDLVEMLAQRLPVGAVAPAGGMGEIGALSVQRTFNHSSTMRQL